MNSNEKHLQGGKAEQVLTLAMQHHTEGRLAEAEGLYQQILQANPNQPVVLHLLGVVAHQVGKNDVSVDLISQATALKPEFAEAHYNLGTALQELGRPGARSHHYRKRITMRRKAGP